MKSPVEVPYTFIDLFSGCGGFTLGMMRAGFKCIAALDNNAEAVDTLKQNLETPSVPGLHPINLVKETDLSRLSPKELSHLVGVNEVDVIVGGPPCQGFSTARQVDGANHGPRLKEDPRRRLYKVFLKYVEYFRPRIFIMENVLGIRSAAGGRYFTAVQKDARRIGMSSGLPGYRVHSQIEDAHTLGAPQKRRRQLIVGVRADLPGYFPAKIDAPKRARTQPPLALAIGDLPILRAGGGTQTNGYNLQRRKAHLRRHGSEGAQFLFDVLEVHLAQHLTGHVARPHNDRDLRDFSRLKEGESSATAMRDRGVEFEFPYDKGCFKDRYTRQSRSAPCSTIVAHLSKDGLMFIHPTQNRSLTPREAARIQTFPDWFQFPEARTHSYRLIGNAVPPIVAEALGEATRTLLGFQDRVSKTDAVHKLPILRNIPKDLLDVAYLGDGTLKAMPKSNFVDIWARLLECFPELHPLNALDHGDVNDVIRYSSQRWKALPMSARLRYARSGWPVAFKQFGLEAWRRHKLGELDQKLLFGVGG